MSHRRLCGINPASLDTTVIARRSDEPSGYWSMPLVMVNDRRYDDISFNGELFRHAKLIIARQIAREAF